jgi:hypothetical protein
MPNGKICYLEMPAADGEVSAGSYGTKSPRVQIGLSDQLNH